MVLLGALRRMPQPLAHRLQPFDPAVDLVGLGLQQLAVDPLLVKHGGYFVQRKASRLSQRYQRQALGGIWRELAALPMAGQ
jgi:hypothetical protein